MSNKYAYIADPVPVDVLEKELNADRFVRQTCKWNNEIYIVNQHNSPNTVREIGRLREWTFALAGGGTGKPLDLDEHDTDELCYEQLIVWAPEAKEIIGGYRFIDCGKVLNTNPIHLSTRHYFKFSNKFKKEYLPITIELGRSWVQPNFQPRADSRRGIFSLDNLWDGLGAITVMNPHIKHFFGKVTMYAEYHSEARDALLYFLHRFFPDKEKLVTPIYPLKINSDLSDFAHSIEKLEYKQAWRVLNKYVRERGENIPPLINSYMGLSSTMKTFGTALNPDFGGVEETGILVTIADIYDEKKARHVESFIQKRN